METIKRNNIKYLNNKPVIDNDLNKFYRTIKEGPEPVAVEVMFETLIQSDINENSSLCWNNCVRFLEILLCFVPECVY